MNASSENINDNITTFISLASNENNIVRINGKKYLTFDLADDLTYNKWDIEGYSDFIFEINLLVGI